MENTVLIKGATIVNEGKEFYGSVFIDTGKIQSIYQGNELPAIKAGKTIDGKGKILLPGIIDDQVHFREPGLTQKGDIYTESKAAVAGGITSFMEMPNTLPQTLTQALLEEKYKTASEKSLANYSFYMGASNDNIEEIKKTDPAKVCGVKVFMGSSTGNMLVNDRTALSRIFAESPVLIAVHCEDEEIIQSKLVEYKSKYGENIPIKYHPYIRNEEACYKSSSLAVELAKKYNSRLHILHVSTAKELSLFDHTIPLGQKRITSEVCVHHLWFSDDDYEKYGNYIKWNPAIKTGKDRESLVAGLQNNKIDVVATDHAPHTFEEKANSYLKSPSGGPLVQHALVSMLELFHQQKISLTNIVHKMCHAPAQVFQITNRGYIREGYWADLVLADLGSPWTVNKENILYKCGWSPFDGMTFRSKVTHTLVNGNVVYEEGNFNETIKGQRLFFNR